jgi:hypothetical protein
MNPSRRNFILGMSSAYTVLSVSVFTGTSMVLKSSQNSIIKETSIDVSDWNFSSYDAFSPALMGTAISSFMLSNVEYLYSLIIILITLFLLFAVGIPGYEYLLPYSELYFINS